MKAKKPLIGIIIGSSNDLPKMDDTAKTLDELGIPYEQKVISAHRNPTQLDEYASSAEENGLEVIIAAAGKAAHLAGAIAARTSLPIIGVPIQTPDLGGIDSLLSTVQMPSGVPVATVAIGGAKNAAILAAQILSIKYPEIRNKIKKLKEEMSRKKY